MKITEIKARQILDSRGNPTVEADVWVNDSFAGRAAVPSGASTGEYEAHELRDGGDEFGGQGVNKAVNNVESEIKDSLLGVACDDQFLIDKKLIELDGTDDKSRLGANATLAVSLACAHAAAKTRQVQLYQHINDIAHNPKMSIPMPMMNVLNGGKHANNSADFQEFMIVPLGAKRYSEAVRIGSEIFQTLKKNIANKGKSTAVGDEGGFTYPVESNEEMLELLAESCEAAGFKLGQDVGFALDVAASEFFDSGQYRLQTENLTMNHADLFKYYEHLAKRFPIVSIEDGLDQDAWDGWTEMNSLMGDIQLVGDDLLVTNPERLKHAISEKAANSILIKPNQIGTLSETIESIKIAQEAGWTSVVSHRSGETEDVTIAHLAVGTGAGQIKTGSLSRSERTAKHNEIMRIESGDTSLKLSNPFDNQKPSTTKPIAINIQ